MKKFIKKYWVILFSLVCAILMVCLGNYPAALWAAATAIWVKVAIIKDEHIEILKEHIETLKEIKRWRTK